MRVKDKNILINNNIIDQLNKSELNWDSLLTDSKIDESVIEYIDPEEQSWSMIATKPRDIVKKMIARQFINILIVKFILQAFSVFLRRVFHSQSIISHPETLINVLKVSKQWEFM